MNTTTDNWYGRMSWLFIGLLVSLSTALAQSDEYYQLNPKTNAQGYWRLSTSLDKRNTIISFFDRQDQLLYQETLSGYHLKPSQRTTDLLDDFLSRLTTDKLVLAHLQSQLVPFPVIEKRLKWNTDSERCDTSSLDIKNRIHCSINSKGIIRLNVLNPTAEPLTIRLTDERGHTLYHNTTQQPEYFSRLNVSSLDNGLFQLTVLDGREKIRYTFKLIKSTQAHFEVQAVAQDIYATIRLP